MSSIAPGCLCDEGAVGAAHPVKIGVAQRALAEFDEVRRTGLQLDGEPVAVAVQRKFAPR